MLTRAKSRQTDTARIRSWGVLLPDVPPGLYTVVEVISLYGLPRLYLAVQTLPNGNQCILSRHRKRTAAERAIVRMAKHH